MASGLAFAGTLALVLVYALRGGSYGVTVFEAQGLVIWWILAVGIALRLLPRARPAPVLLLLVAALLAYALWTGLSLTWTESSERTTEELARVLDYAGIVALLAITLDRKTWRAAAAGLGLGGAAICLLALGSRLWPAVFPQDAIDRTFHVDRLSYPFGYWNAMGAWGAMTMAIALGWSAHDTARLRRAVALALVPAAGVMTYLTYSRAAIGGTALALIAVVALSRHRFSACAHALAAGAATTVAIVLVRHHPQIAHATGSAGSATVALALGAGMLACAAVGVITGVAGLDRLRLARAVFRPLAAVCAVVLLAGAAVAGPRLVSRGWHSFTRTTVVSSDDTTGRLTSLSGSRYPLWKVTLKAFDSHPAFGIGAGTIEFWWDRHGTNGEFIRNAHSLWLQDLAELGIPGLLLILAVSTAAIGVGVATVRRARRSASAGVAAAFTAAFLVYLLHASVDWMWESTAVTVLALAGIAVIGARMSEPRSRLRPMLRIGLVGLALAAGAIQIPGLLSNWDIGRSQAAAREGNAPLALAYARDAVSAQPWSASAYEQRGLVLEAEGRLAQAAADLRRAISHERTNFQHWLILARIETEEGNVGAAVADYDQARRLRPHASVFALAPYFSPGPR